MKTFADYMLAGFEVKCGFPDHMHYVLVLQKHTDVAFVRFSKESDHSYYSVDVDKISDVF